MKTVIAILALASLAVPALAQHQDERLERPIEVRSADGTVTYLGVNTASGWSQHDQAKNGLDVKPFAADGGASASENAAAGEAE